MHYNSSFGKESLPCSRLLEPCYDHLCSCRPKARPAPPGSMWASRSLAASHKWFFSMPPNIGQKGPDLSAPLAGARSDWLRCCGNGCPVAKDLLEPGNIAIH